ncbi:beta-N-acetylglucosaminidase [Corynebacterium phoceense]|uniref:beta-N-acetylglucosaminidase n=1 Tax=Corynebacterium phoceense TaxID=1686286 RepID=UPI00211BDBA7|nr:beta-N-acetylglucosaminidase [Corynebacterium phoceense]MCQ9330445.1 beta-N-acetylglucosaminidase [Corynebacterium phoceense]MCQ9349211.1 beta-N-acetylglucosaminidase [Corynebacterium phoceense]
MRHVSAAHSLARLATVALIPALLVGCGSDDTADTPPETPAPAAPASPTVTSTSASSTSSPAATTSASTSATSSASESLEPSSSSATTTSSASRSSRADSVEDVADIFGTLAPRSFFSELEECDSAGLKDSYNCSGPEVGQFQFSKSETKAAQTTQLLEELKSSRLLYNDDVRLVGWTMFGSTAIITVVDNDEGLVMQQMTSTDEQDPKDKIRELGLLDGVDAAEE